MTDSTPANPTDSPTDDHQHMRQEVEAVLDLIRPAVQSDGGDVELVGVTDAGVVTVRFHGACVGCPSSSMTLRSGIEQNLKTRVPSVREVIAVN